MNQSAGAVGRWNGGFVPGSRQRFQYLLHNLCLQLRDLALKGLCHGVRHDLLDLDLPPFVLFFVPFRHAQKPFFLRIAPVRWHQPKELP